jgi:hypothetical protein
MKKQDQKPEMILLVDGNRGIYVPYVFWGIYKDNIIGGEGLPEWIGQAMADPDNEDYWEAMDWLEDNTTIEIGDMEYLIYWHDGDLWAIPQGYSWEDFAE